jgi:3-ketosteroid 9alpha-monooxygenase subunit B
MTGQVSRALGATEVSIQERGPGYRLKVREVIAETQDSRSIVLEVPVGLEDRFQYQPGQFLTVRVPSTDGRYSIARCYSLSSTPAVDDHLMVNVKRVEGGHASNWIFDHVRAGDQLEVLPPAGRFVPESLDADLLLFAAGSGITPIISIATSVLARGTGSVALVYANRHEAGVIYANRLTRLRALHPDRLILVHVLESVEGMLTDEMVAAYARVFGPRHAAFICGPGPFMTAVERGLERSGMVRDQIVVERFVSLEGDPFAATRPSAPGEAREDLGPDNDMVKLTVSLEGEERHLLWPRSTRLLDALLAAGLDVPYSCREGACSACVCRVKAGEVAMARNEVLEAEDIEDGLVLACQARAVTDEVEIAYK